jgi:hypothetical protein
MLNNGNIIKRSKVLKHYLSEELGINYDRDLFLKDFGEYQNSIENIPGIENFNNVFYKLHDSYFKEFIINNNITLNLNSYEKGESFNIILKFNNASLKSFNSIRKSGRITTLNKIPTPRIYMYNELFSENGKNYITIIAQNQKRIRTGNVYYPFFTIQFESIQTELNINLPLNE